MAKVSPFFEASLDGFTGGSLLFEAKLPGVPDRLFSFQKQKRMVIHPVGYRKTTRKVYGEFEEKRYTIFRVGRLLNRCSQPSRHSDLSPDVSALDSRAQG